MAKRPRGKYRCAGDSGALWPNEFRPQTIVDRAAVIRLGISLSVVVKRVIGRFGKSRAVAHDIRYRHPDALLFVIKHDNRTAFTAGTKLQRAIGIIGVEGLALQIFWMIHRQIAMVEKGNMGGLLASHRFADIAVADVVVYRLIVGAGVNVVAAAGIRIGHRDPV